MNLVADYLAGYTGNTAAAYRRDLADWAIFFAGELLSATRADVNSYTRGMEARDLSASTIARRLSAIKGLYAYAVVEGLAQANPVEHVRRPRVSQDSQTLGLDQGEAVSFLQAARADSARSYAIASLLLHTGLRVSEALSLHTDDLVIDGGVRVARIHGKGGKVRVIPLAGCADALDAYLAGRTGAVFVTRTGAQWTRSAAFQAVRRIATAADIEQPERCTPHSLRHTSVTAALDTGASLRDVQDFAGHSDSRMTRRYDRAAGNLLRSPAHALASYFAA